MITKLVEPHYLAKLRKRHSRGFGTGVGRGAVVGSRPAVLVVATRGKLGAGLGSERAAERTGGVACPGARAYSEAF